MAHGGASGRFRAVLNPPGRQTKHHGQLACLSRPWKLSKPCLAGGWRSASSYFGAAEVDWGTMMRSKRETRAGDQALRLLSPSTFQGPRNGKVSNRETGYAQTRSVRRALHAWQRAACQCAM